MRPRVLIIGNDLQREIGLVISLGPAGYAADIIESDQPLQSAIRQPVAALAALIVRLDGHENVADLRAALEKHAESRFLFLAREYPLSAAKARIVGECQGVVLRSDESPVVVAATLVAMLASNAATATA